MDNTPNLTLSHLELRVADLETMERFYTEVLGFVVTDRGAGINAMVFLSRSPNEHHQIVLSPGGNGDPGALDHVAMRVDSLAALKHVYRKLKNSKSAAFETVSHGNSWSLYITDPEGNRVEVFTDTPWHVAQPVRFAIDLDSSDEEIARLTEEKIGSRADFASAEQWRLDHRKRMEG